MGRKLKRPSTNNPMNPSGGSGVTLTSTFFAAAGLSVALSQRKAMDDVVPQSYCFVATTISIATEDNVLTVGVTSPDGNEYLLLQRDLDFCDSSDPGIYLELNDQINSGYSLVKQCVVAPTRLILLLDRPLLKAKRIVVDLPSPRDDNDFVNGLSQIFTGYLDRLVIRP